MKIVAASAMAGIGETAVVLAACGAAVALGILLFLLYRWLSLFVPKRGPRVDLNQHLANHMRKQANFYRNTFMDGYNEGKDRYR